MRNKSLFLIYISLAVVLSSIPFTLQSYEDSDVEDDDDSNPFLDMASNFIQQSMSGNGGDTGGLAALGGILGGLMQGGGGKNIADAIMGMQGGKNNGAGEILSGLSNLLTNKDGEIDPNLINTVISVFADSVSKNNDEGKKKGKNVKKRDVMGDEGKSEEDQEELPGLDMMGVVTSLLSNYGNKKSSQSENLMEGLMGALPMITQVINSFTGPDANARAHKHSDHAWFLPPLMEKMHIYWDSFVNSPLGIAYWENSGLSDLTKTFTDKKGNIDYELVLKSLENHSFRRKWISKATSHLTTLAIHLSNPEVQHRYLTTSQFLVNNFLRSQDFPMDVVFQPARFTESVSNILNHVLKKYLNAPTDAIVYVRPAVKYVNDILSTAESHGTYLRSVNQSELSDKLTDTLNLEIIEPVLKVYRAYRFARKKPQCQTHVLCVINKHDPNEKLGLPGFKAGLTKLSSFAASAALSYQGGHGFWDLYNVIQDDSNCQAKYPVECDDFHEEEVKVTTEYYHNEL